MRGSLQDQLLQFGIATEEQLKKPANKHKPTGRNAKTTNKPNKTNKKPAAKPPQVEKKPVKAPEEPKSLGKALRTEIKQLLKTNKLNDKVGEIPYNYVIAGQVKRFYINETQQTELKAGNMVIVNWNTISYLITKEAEVELRKLHPTIEVASVPKPDENATKKDSNDPYSDYEIPDDLSW